MTSLRKAKLSSIHTLCDNALAYVRKACSDTSQEVLENQPGAKEYLIILQGHRKALEHLSMLSEPSFNAGSLDEIMLCAEDIILLRTYSGDAMGVIASLL